MVLASNNLGKIKEVKEIFSDMDIYSLKEKNITVDVEENQDSFYGNALKKAKEIYEICNEPVIADDSGLCIDILNDWPGVFTHRFLGEGATDSERNDEILNRLKDYSYEDRNARVICSIVYYDGENIITGDGILDGKISICKRGNNGFGFDEIFEISNGYTLAELSDDEKNRISARYLALIDLKKKLINDKKLIK